MREQAMSCAQTRPPNVVGGVTFGKRIASKRFTIQSAPHLPRRQEKTGLFERKRCGRSEIRLLRAVTQLALKLASQFGTPIAPLVGERIRYKNSTRPRCDEQEHFHGTSAVNETD